MGDAEAINPAIEVNRASGTFVRNSNTGEHVFDALTGKLLYSFRPESEITEEMRDPDYALKQLKKLNNGKYTITCSKCHHCR